MSGGGWTLDSLERYLTDKIEALDRFCVANFQLNKERVDMALSSSDKAISKAEQATEKRFEGVNEFRATLSDQALNLLPRSEYRVQHSSLEERIGRLTAELGDLKANLRGKKEGVGTIGAMVLGAAVIISTSVAIIALIK